MELASILEQIIGLANFSDDCATEGIDFDKFAKEMAEAIKKDLKLDDLEKRIEVLKKRITELDRFPGKWI